MPTPRQESASADDNGRQTQDLARSRRRRFSSPSNTEADSPPSKRKRTSDGSENGEPQRRHLTAERLELSQAPQSLVIPSTHIETVSPPLTSSSTPELGSENEGVSSTPHSAVNHRMVGRRTSDSGKHYNEPTELDDSDSDMSDASAVTDKDRNSNGNFDLELEQHQSDSQQEQEQHEDQQQKRPMKTTHGTTPKAGSKRRRLRLSRGKYRPRSLKGWGAFFKDQNPTVTEDGTVIIDDEYEETKAFLRDKWHKSFSLLKAPEEGESLLSEISAPLDSEVTDNEFGALKKKKRKKKKVDDSITFTKAANKKLKQELEDWALDPPDMQYPYLQSAFPYEDYEPPGDRIDSSSQGSLLQPMTLDWYRPQGPISGEDLFSMEKYTYASKMIQAVEVDTDNLRMDVYYQRGFELASRKILDRARSKLRKDKQAEIDWNSDEENPSATEVQSQRNGAHTNSTSDALSSQQSLTQRNTGQDTNIPSTGGPNSPMELDSAPPVADTSQHPYETEPSTARMEETQESSLTSESNSKDTTDGTPGSPIEQSGVDATTESVTLSDYYLVNKFLSSIFVPNDPMTDVEAILSPGARRILQTMLTGLESKIIGMGCHLQRMELTKRLGEVDLKRASNKVAQRMKRKIQGLELAASELASSGQAAFEQAGEESAEATEYATMEIEEASNSNPNMPPPPSPAKPRGKYPRSTLPFYYRLKKVDMDDYVTKRHLSGPLHRYKLDHIRDSYRFDSRPLSPSPAPSLDQSSAPSSAFASLAGTPLYCFIRSASVSTTTSFFTEADDTQSLAESDVLDDVGSQSAQKPFISNPLGIPDTMDPFYKARNYLEKVNPPPASSRPPAIASASRPRSDSVPPVESTATSGATTPVRQGSVTPVESTATSEATIKATPYLHGSIESTATSEAMNKATPSLQGSVSPLSQSATVAVTTSHPRVDPTSPSEPTTTTTTGATTSKAMKVTLHREGSIAALLEAAKSQSIGTQEANSTSARTGSGLSWAPIKPRTRFDGEETESE
ncbi:hypothetical protein BGX26_012739 [Mortierella sp. AD094]|nr:hypothetical protein BGX26_012739 [Mortierella sp. AD094]